MRAYAFFVVSFFAYVDDAVACECDGGPKVLSPRRDEPIPTNAALVVLRPTEFEVRLDGAPIELVSAVLLDGERGDDVALFRPAAGEWPANVTLDLFGDERPTGDGPAAAEDAAPNVVVTNTGAISRREDCIDHGRFFALVEDGDKLLARSRDGADVEAPTISGIGRRIGTTSGCEDLRDWPEADFGVTTLFRFASVRIDGSLSPFGPPVEISLPGDRDCDGIDDESDQCPDQPGATNSIFGLSDEIGGCTGEPEVNTCTESCACSSSNPAGLLLLLPLLARRRRHRSI